MKHSLLRFSGLAAASVLALFVTLSCGKDDKSTQVNPEPALITDMSVISNAPDRTALVGKKVDISSATVQSVVGTYLFWAGDPRTAVPVAREDRMHDSVAEHVRAGEHCRITGTVRLLETVPSTDVLWDRINDQERRDLLASRVYIAADKVSVVH